MSVDEELTRQLRARAALVRSEPDLAELSRRIRLQERRAVRRERLAVAGAAVVLAGSLGGLVGSLVSSRRVAQPSERLAGGTAVLGPGPAHASRAAHRTPTLQPPRLLVSETLAGGLAVRVTVQPLGSPVEVDGAWGSFSICGTGQIVTTTVGSGSSVGSGTGVTGLVALGSGGIEVVSSGSVPMTSGGGIWWVVLAVGSSVARVAAEGASGGIVATRPVQGLAVLASTSASSESWVSTVAEAADGQSLSSMQVLLGDGLRFVNAPSSSTGRCSELATPQVASSASASQPASPALAASSVIGSFEQAFSPDLLQGYASNLAAVVDGAELEAEASASAESGSFGPLSVPRAPDGPPVLVRQVTFVSAGAAEVIYRLSDGIWRVGSAALGSDGTWRVTRATYCAAVRAGAPLVVPDSVTAACGSAGG